ncbi:MAG: hypothetical protein ACFB6R_11175 [Alphaproteobacteria bacterium]
MAPDVHFLMPLKAPCVAGMHWPTTATLAVESMVALLGQSDPRFTLHLLCHTPPDDLPAHASLRVHVVTHPAPPADADLATRMRDKALKLAHGYQVIRDGMAQAGAFVVQADADDFVHGELTAVLLDGEPPQGRIFKSGLYYDAGLGRAWEIDRFHVLCGTCAAPFFAPGEIPDLADAVDQDLAALGDRFWPLSIRHGDWVDRAAAAGRPLSPLPFPGAVYRINTGTNNHGPRRVRFRHRHPFFYRRFTDQGGTTWVHQPDLARALAPFNAMPPGARGYRPSRGP